MAGQELPKRIPLQHQQQARLGRDRIRGPRLVIEQGELAMEPARPQATQDQLFAIG
jgi:hypothetical protein